MIVGIEGKLEFRGSGWAIIKVDGLSFQVYMPTPSLERLGGVGEEVKLYTYLYVREDKISLYGFASAEELGLFEMLVGVSGVGPKTALSLLSAVNPDQLSIAIASGDVELLSQIPGIGKKMASRLVLELRGKLEALRLPASLSAQANTDVMAALTGLGYSMREATAAIAALPDSPMSLEEKVRLALQHLAGRS